MYNVKGTYIFPKTQVLEKAIKEISWSVKTENPKTKKLGNHGKLLFIFSLNCLTVSLYSSTSTSNDTLKKLHREKKKKPEYSLTLQGFREKTHSCPWTTCFMDFLYFLVSTE